MRVAGVDARGVFMLAFAERMATLLSVKTTKRTLMALVRHPTA